VRSRAVVLALVDAGRPGLDLLGAQRGGFHHRLFFCFLQPTSKICLSCRLDENASNASNGRRDSQRTFAFLGRVSSRQ
jgi:hypothetical protein